MITREVLDHGLRLVTEAMPHVRSITIGVWLTRGSRHEREAQSGIADFVEHMLFKGTAAKRTSVTFRAVRSLQRLPRLDHLTNSPPRCPDHRHPASRAKPP